MHSRKKRDPKIEFKKTLKWQMEEMEPTKETEKEQVEILEGNQDRVRALGKRRR